MRRIISTGMLLAFCALSISKVCAQQKLRLFDELIKPEARTSVGFITIHQIDNKYYFEIPDSIFFRDILIVSRIGKSSSVIKREDGTSGYSGDRINKNVIRLERGPGQKVYLRKILVKEKSTDSSVNGMYANVQRSNLQPIEAVFDVIASNGSSIIVDLTDYFNSDNDLFFFDNANKELYKLGAEQTDKSDIKSIRAFPTNIEIKALKTYRISGEKPGNASFELNTSFLLLPKIPMRARYSDSRVGYLVNNIYLDLDKNPLGTEKVGLIGRYRLEPKEKDIEKYRSGELVEPKKPIVFYIDPTTPKKWVSYMIQGVNDWQVAFEQAGFKNAIIAKEAPKNDPTWSLEDARHSAIVYEPSSYQNATGGVDICDPRSGEVVEAHISWYHSVMRVWHHQYMIQAGAVDPRARKMIFDDALMGAIIRSVIAHEVGHTLGLDHNMASSSTVLVDMLRNKKWLDMHGHTPSIMDYSRANYIAQPEDGITDEAGLLPRIGEYDKWAIEWGYRWFPDFKDQKTEEAFLNKWIIDSLNSNPRLWFSDQTGLDPRVQTEDLGNNAMKAGEYGISNLRRILPQLKEWTKTPNQGYDNLKEIYQEAVKQFGRYMGHASKYIGGTKTTPKTTEQQGAVYQFVDKASQKRAIAFLQDNLFTTPLWLVKTPYGDLIGTDPLATITDIQQSQLDRIFDTNTGYSFLKSEAQAESNAELYTLPEMWNDVKEGIWSELKSGQTIDIYRKSLQKAYVEKLTGLISLKNMRPNEAKWSELQSLARQHATSLLREIQSATAKAGDLRTKAHLQDLSDKLEAVLGASKTPGP